MKANLLTRGPMCAPRGQGGGPGCHWSCGSDSASTLCAFFWVQSFHEVCISIWEMLKKTNKQTKKKENGLRCRDSPKQTWEKQRNFWVIFSPSALSLLTVNSNVSQRPFDNPPQEAVRCPQDLGIKSRRLIVWLQL